MRQAEVITALIGKPEHILDLARGFHHIVEEMATRFIFSREKLISTRLEM